MPAGHMTAHQIADQFGITLEGVRKLVQRGRLHRAGGSPRQPWYDTAEVIALARRKAA